MRELIEPFGPEYPRELGTTVAKFRRKSRRGLSKLSAEERRAYGNAVHAAILSKQRSALARVSSDPRPNCASGTLHTDGRKIAEAIRRQHVGALRSYVVKVRRCRTPREWRSMYDEAMAEKRAAQAVPLAA